MHYRAMTRRTFLAGTVGTMLATGALAENANVVWPFYVMDTGLVGPDVPTLADKINLTKEARIYRHRIHVKPRADSGTAQASRRRRLGIDGDLHDALH